MATTVSISADNADGWITAVNTTNWATSRDAITGTADHNDARQQYAIRVRKVASGRGNQWRVSRAFFTFNTLRVTATPVSATLNIRGFGSATANISVVKSTHSVPLVATDFNNITGWTTGNNDGNVTYYGPNTAITWSTALNTIQLNQTALSNIASLDSFKLCLLNYTYDLRDVEPTTGDDLYSGCYFNDDTSSTSRPYITIHPDNTTFFGANF